MICRKIHGSILIVLSLAAFAVGFLDTALAFKIAPRSCPDLFRRSPDGPFSTNSLFEKVAPALRTFAKELPDETHPFLLGQTAKRDFSSAIERTIADLKPEQVARLKQALERADQRQLTHMMGAYFTLYPHGSRMVLAERLELISWLKPGTPAPLMEYEKENYVRGMISKLTNSEVRSDEWEHLNLVRSLSDFYPDWDARKELDLKVDSARQALYKARLHFLSRNPDVKYSGITLDYRSLEPFFLGTHSVVAEFFHPLGNHPYKSMSNEIDPSSMPWMWGGQPPDPLQWTKPSFYDPSLRRIHQVYEGVYPADVVKTVVENEKKLSLDRQFIFAVIAETDRETGLQHTLGLIRFTDGSRHVSFKSPARLSMELFRGESENPHVKARRDAGFNVVEIEKYLLERRIHPLLKLKIKSDQYHRVIDFVAANNPEKTFYYAHTESDKHTEAYNKEYGLEILPPVKGEVYTPGEGEMEVLGTVLLEKVRRNLAELHKIPKMPARIDE